MTTHPEEEEAGQATAPEEPKDHVLRLLRRYHGPGPGHAVDGAQAGATGEAGGREPQEYHLPHLVVDVTKQMVAAAAARDAAELERYEAKVEDAVEYLRHQRPWHLHHKEWFVIIMLGMLQHATLAMYGDEQEADKLLDAATSEYLALTQADPLDGPHEREEKVGKWMRELWKDAWLGDEPSHSKFPDNARLTASACLTAQALTRYLPKDVATWEDWWDILLPQEEEDLAGGSSSSG
jgi:hypothetical protein